MAFCNSSLGFKKVVYLLLTSPWFIKDYLLVVSAEPHAGLGIQTVVEQQGPTSCSNFVLHGMSTNISSCSEHKMFQSCVQECTKTTAQQYVQFNFNF